MLTSHMMEESGENWPSDDLDLETGNEVNEFCLDEEEEGLSFADRKRRQRELNDRLLLALSATIPGLNEVDDTSILEKASKYVKQLEKRVRELEQEQQEVESKTICSNKKKGTITSREVNSVADNYNYGSSSIENNNNDNLPQVKARILQNQALIIIHCEKQKGVMLKILSQLENLHLSLVNSSVLRFGQSTLDITIIAQMGDGYNMTVDELVTTLKLTILTQ